MALESIVNLSSHINNPVATTTDKKDGTLKTKMPTMVKGMSVILDQQPQSRMEIPFLMAFYVVSEGLAFKKFSGLFDLQENNGLDIGMQYHHHHQTNFDPGLSRKRGWPDLPRHCTDPVLTKSAKSFLQA